MVARHRPIHNNLVWRGGRSWAQCGGNAPQRHRAGGVNPAVPVDRRQQDVACLPTGIGKPMVMLRGACAGQDLLGFAAPTSQRGRHDFEPVGNGARRASSTIHIFRNGASRDQNRAAGCLNLAWLKFADLAPRQPSREGCDDECVSAPVQPGRPPESIQQCKFRRRIENSTNASAGGVGLDCATPAVPDAAAAAGEVQESFNRCRVGPVRVDSGCLAPVSPQLRICKQNRSPRKTVSL